MTRSFFILFFLGCWSFSYGQIRLEGKVYSQEGGYPVPDAYVVIKDVKSGRTLGTALTDTTGYFRSDLAATDTLALMVKIHHYAYLPLQRQLIVLPHRHPVRLTFRLKPRVENLDEVVLDVRPAIVVKKDTIIYDVRRLASEGDESVADLLKKLGDFELTPDGQIKLKGRTVDKVLVNGEEISRAGASEIVKSIDPSKVEKIEVRFREENERFKESLLDRKDLVILDIQLKKLPRPYFGRLKGSGVVAGNKFDAALYANFFYLKPRAKIHFLAENHPAGDTYFSIFDLSRMGEEAWEQMLAVSGDFDEMKKKEGYKDEIFGVKDYHSRRRGIGGITAFVKPAPHWEVFGGFFIAFDRLGTLRSRYGYWPGDTLEWTSRLAEERTISQNKVEIIYRKPDTRFQTGVFLSYKNTRFDQRENFTFTNDHLTFGNSDTTYRLLARARYEHRFGKRWTGQAAVEGGSARKASQSRLIHTFEEAADRILDADSSRVYDLGQYFARQYTFFHPSFQWQYALENLSVTLYYDFYTHRYRLQQKASRLSNGTPVPAFTALLDFPYREQQTGVKFQWTIGEKWDVYFHPYFFRLAVSRPSPAVYEELFYTLRAGYRPYAFSGITLSYMRKYAPLAIERYFRFVRLKDAYTFQFFAGEPFRLYAQDILTADAYIEINGAKINAAYLYGRTRGKDVYRILAPPFTARYPSALKSFYHTVSVSYKNQNAGRKFTWELIPEFIYVCQEGEWETRPYCARTLFYLLGLKPAYDWKKYRLRLEGFGKLTRISYRNDLMTARPSTTNWRYSLSLRWEPDRTALKIKFTGIRFPAMPNTRYDMLEIRFKRKFTHSAFFLDVYNALNRKYFLMQDWTPISFWEDRVTILPRYLQMGWEWVF